MTEQQEFQPGDKIKVTMNLIVADPKIEGSVAASNGTIYPWTAESWANELDHVDVELIERLAPAREPGWYLCAYGVVPHAMRWDGTNWRWPGRGECVPFQDRVVAIGTITLNEGIEL